MATNTIRIYFEECEPAPPNGYLVKYRPQGSDEPYREATADGSPAVIVDNNDPLNTPYEGTIQGDCGLAGLGPEIPWEVGGSLSGSISVGESEPPPVEEFDYYFADEYDCGDCFGPPVQENILVRVPAGHVIQPGKFYRPVGHPTGFVYTLFPPAQPPASSVELTEANFNTCALACAG